MAASQDIVISEILCFLIGKLGKAPEKFIKTVILNFYDENEICAGKDLLHSHMESLKIDGLPRRLKRKGENKVKMDVDDILVLISLADERLLIDDLPTFVAKNIDRLPIVKPEDLDVFVLAQKVSVLESKMMMQPVVQPIMQASTSGISTTVGLTGDIAGATNMTKTAFDIKLQKNHSTTKEKIRSYKEVAEVAEVINVDEEFRNDQDEPFTTVVHKKRKHATKKAATVGTSIQLSDLTAARPLVRKAVFHVDNLAENCNPESIVNHLKLMDIAVVSCYESKSWSKQGQDGIKVKAVRLCVDQECKNRVLDKEAWPTGIIVRPWRFKNNEVGRKPAVNLGQNTTTE